MNKSIYYFKRLTATEVGRKKTHEYYVRFPNDFDYKKFFNNSLHNNNGVLEYTFKAKNLTVGHEQDALIDLRFVYFINSNKEKRIPSLRVLFEENDVKEGDIVKFESQVINDENKYFITFLKAELAQISPEQFYFFCESPAPRSPRPSFPFQKIFFGTPGSGKSFRVNQIVEGAEPRTFRTTFHPDSDYAAFVGCYKPTQKEATITYEFVPQTFTNAYIAAWNNPNEPHFLIIEEINRGNCAQIFGDLFQLLDRNSDGTSQYGIKADADLADYLKKHLQNSDGIANDELHLPSNLHLLATMNTSDQSLFPMDSAFKRRWAWEYVPIDYGHPVSTQFIINLSGKKYHWLNFLQKINEKIKKTTDAEDKQMGNFFINGDISEAEFKNKVMFYLWSEVCKEEYGTPRNFFRNGNDSENHEFTFNDLFTANGNELLHGFMQYVGVKEYEAFAEQIVSSTIQMEELSKAAEQEQPTLQ